MIAARQHLARIRERVIRLEALTNRQLGTIEGGLDRVAYDLGEAISYVTMEPHPDEPDDE